MARARFVAIEPGRVDEYAQGLVRAIAAEPAEEAPLAGEGGAEAVAAFAICMNAINFGSGWWPTIRKRPGHSGYATMAAGVRERFASYGAWSVEELVVMDASAIAAVVGQDPEHPLMTEFATALRDVGEHLLADHDGRYLALAEGVESIPALSAVFAGWGSFADVSHHDGHRVPFFKRAQIAAADLHRAAIDAGELLTHGSPEEVELRAAAVHAVELLAAATGNAASPAAIDSALWNRGRGRRYKARPRPRSRNTAY